MTTSAQFIGVAVVLAAMFASTLLPMEPTMRALTAALIIAVGGGVMAFLGSRN